jgi:urease accessory protein
MLNVQKKFQRAHGNINVKINNNEVNRFYQSGSAKVFYPKSPQEIKELVLVNTAGGLTSGDNFFYNIDIINKSKIFVTTQTAERVYKGINDNAEIKVTLSVDDTSDLFWIPQELILFNNCNLIRKIEVNLKSNSNFLLAESTIFGRTAMGEFLEKGFFKDNWKIYLNEKLIHAEALSLTGNIKDKLSSIASTDNGVAICNIFISGKNFLSKEDLLIKTLKNSEIILSSHSKWNDKMLIRIVSKDAYELKLIKKKLISYLAEKNLPKVWNN